MIDVDSNARAIFYEALDRASPDERSAYLEEACGQDPELRGRVDDLLRAHREAGNFLGGVVDDTIEHSPIAEGPGTVIGPYKLLQQIGEGGFGVVFLAEQERPVRRRVALKVIKPGMDTRQVIARFEAERQALALMDHPNIAKVHDAGATENGRPYFVMELVQGVPITDYCDQCNLTTDERLELFITVCQAVQHAHQKGVIHRDIKPTNVLVAIQDGQPAPKIIDFGVAKAINQQLTEHTLMTAFAQIVGTPLYMSPEQAELSPLGVDTRSDIYSLGALLYELLTGATPFDKDRLHAASYDEFRRIIREEEPPRPSARLSTLSAVLATTIAERRRTDARRLSQQVRAELDWIVMKCLEKDRNRRYETPNSLARDIQRYLHDEPVQACPPSAAYRLKKFIRRNKVAAGFVVLLLIGLTGLGISNIAIKRERDAKATALSRAQAISDLLEEMLASSNPDQVKGPQYTVRQLLDEFSEGLGDQLAAEPELEAAIRSVIGKSYWRLGVNSTAEQHLKKALELRRRLYGTDDERVADSRVDYARSLGEQRRYAEAEKNVRDAILVYRKHDSDHRSIVRALWTLQDLLLRQSRLTEAEQVANEAMALAGDAKYSQSAELPLVLHNLANVKSNDGKHQEAEKLARRAVDMHRRLHGDHHPETAWGLWVLGEALIGQQKFAEAEAPLREALAIFREYYTPEFRAVQGVTHELASVLEARNDRAGLDVLLREQADQATRSNSPGYHVRLAEVLLSNGPSSEAQKDEAQRLIRRAIEEYGQVAVDYPHDSDRRVKAAAGFVELLRTCAANPDFAKEAEEVNRRLSAELPQIVLDAERLADSAASADAISAVALIRLRMGDEAGYRATCKALINLPDYAANEVIKLRSIFFACLAPNSLVDSNLLVTRAEESLTSVPQEYRHFGLTVLGAALYRAGQYEQAAERLEESDAVYHSVPPLVDYDVVNHQRLLMAMTRWQLGQRDGAQRLLAESRAAIEKELKSPWVLWSRRTWLEILRHEAEAMISPEEARAAVPNVDPIKSADRQRTTDN